MNAPIATIQRLKQSFQKGKMYVFVVTNESNESGCQIVQDRQGIRHLLTGTRKSFTPGKSIRLEVKGYSHSPSNITGSYYLVLSPPAPKESSSKKEPYSGKVIKPPKNKLTGFGPKFLKKKYSVGERYLFYVTGDKDNKGRQLLEDSFGIRHILTGTSTEYLPGDNVRCTVQGFSEKVSPSTQNYFMILSHPRAVNKQHIILKYVKRPELWIKEVQGLDKHQSGKPFTCACCGRDFPGKMGYRVDLKDIYFCKPCARQIFETKPRRTEPSIIYTPMGNKR